MSVGRPEPLTPRTDGDSSSEVYTKLHYIETKLFSHLQAEQFEYNQNHVQTLSQQQRQQQQQQQQQQQPTPPPPPPQQQRKPSAGSGSDDRSSPDRFSTGLAQASGSRPAGHVALSSGTDTDSDDGAMVLQAAGRAPVPGEYNPNDYRDLQVGRDVRDLFQYITKYTPQHLGLDYKFRPFVPDYIPAVGDIDAFLKVGAPGSSAAVHLGLAVLDEPAAGQSDPALLHLQLRAVTVAAPGGRGRGGAAAHVVKRVHDVERHARTVDRWVKDVSDLHRARPPLVVKHSERMPDLDALMQEWPAHIEMLLRKDGFPSHRLPCSLHEYVDLVCALFGVPVHTRRIESLHVLFSLLAAVRGSQLYRGLAVDAVGAQSAADAADAADQLILD